ncbi:MAG: aromatic ring-hydroxylating dioxygenase subunit alpha [Deltaproteobacteria bacterium]|nr:aromatic ring-hydroxylating dioxygenase subunit alpha [Deltaproteobacteria bacterium]
MRVAERLERAETLDPACYTDPAHYARDVERVFRRGWICFGREDWLPDAGDYFAFERFGEPLVAVRDDERRVRVLSNVCRHRWHRVAEGRGNARALQCKYHLWTFALDGRLLGAPQMDRAEGFDRASCRLPELRVESWLGWLYLSFDASAAPLAPQLSGMEKLVAPYQPGRMRSLPPLELDSPWNWKLMIENFMESYHVTSIHPETLEPGFPGAVTWGEENGGGPWAVLHNPTRTGEPGAAFLPVTPGLSHAQLADFLVCCAFPLQLFAVTPDSAVWYELLPHSADRFTLRIHPLAPPEATEEQRMGLRSALEAIHREDVRACESVQQGLRSTLATRGRLSHLERCNWQFHRWLEARIT